MYTKEREGCVTLQSYALWESLLFETRWNQTRMREILYQEDLGPVASPLSSKSFWTCQVLNNEMFSAGMQGAKIKINRWNKINFHNANNCITIIYFITLSTFRSNVPPWEFSSNAREVLIDKMMRQLSKNISFWIKETSLSLSWLLISDYGA